MRVKNIVSLINNRNNYSTIEAKRISHPNAYKKWTAEDDEKLKSLWGEGKTVKELSDLFGRNVGSITSRITQRAVKNIK